MWRASRGKRDANTPNTRAEQGERKRKKKFSLCLSSFNSKRPSPSTVLSLSFFPYRTSFLRGHAEKLRQERKKERRGERGRDQKAEGQAAGARGQGLEHSSPSQTVLPLNAVPVGSV